MSTQVQFRRGNTAQTSTFTGATAEITVDTDKETIVVHDGSTAGGFPLARESSSNTAGSYANSAFSTANFAFSAANTSAAAGSYSNSAFGVANSAASYANSAFSTANFAFSAANTADAKAVTAGSYANSGFTQANSNYTSAVTKLDVINSGSSAYLIDQYNNVANQTIYVSAGETIAFNLNVSGHPFVIRESPGSANTSNGLTHVSTTGVVSTGASAQGKVSGVLYWKVDFSLAGSTYVYQCTIHGGMVGNIVIQQPASFVAANTTLAFNAANSAASYANSAFQTANNQLSYVANSAASYANSAFLAANTPSHVANSAASYANGAFASANTKLSSSGGTITGDISINGNLTVTGNTTYTNTRTVLIADNIITVNAAIDQSSQPAVNAGIEVDRGAQPNSSFLWIETSGKWAANNGNTEIFLASEATLTSAFIAANTPSHVANSAASYANAAFSTANSAFAEADSAASYANSAFASANNSAGVNLTQNTNITNAGVYANSAFNHANVVFAFANTISGGAAIDNTARSLANSASLYANSAFAAANTDVTNITISPSETYGNASYYPVITVSANGRINAVSTQVVTDPSAIAFAIALG
jgi:hypothetical protein